MFTYAYVDVYIRLMVRNYGSDLYILIEKLCLILVIHIEHALLSM